MNKKKHIAIVGAGLVGALIAIFMKRRGYHVSVFERRADLRQIDADHGRSINLALSNRGLRAMSEVGLGDMLTKLALPMRGRMIHNTDGDMAFQPYGTNGQCIHSISRRMMTHDLIRVAESMGVDFFFEYRCRWVDLENTVITFEHPHGALSQSFDILFGADGAFSSVRSMMQLTDRYDYAQSYLKHGYKELTIPACTDGKFGLEKNALHIWPRESFMLIALPNLDGSFTCTLFLAYEGTPSFSELPTGKDATAFFERVFPDVVALMPGLEEEFEKNPVSSLVTISSYPWVVNNTVLIGDAAHGIVPFFGQGLNSGFEDCRILNDLLDTHEDRWDEALSAYQVSRKRDADAIAQLALDNFIEMRDLVADPTFLLRKKIEARLHELYPEKWIPLYSMVTFQDDIPYRDAQSLGDQQRKIMNEVMKTPGLTEDWTRLDFASIVERLK